ncbi:MAG: hypothetical protein DWH91_16605 [Planctomycetota bacterium]|nr:MAG: hypothetical protein DWH91_16605 [Planctomycetota bacterium]
MTLSQIPPASREGFAPAQPAAAGLWGKVSAIVRPLASLKLTVVLLALASFNVLAGTLAQVDADVWQAVREYFRIDKDELAQARSFRAVFENLFVWIRFEIFTPPAICPGMEPIPDKYGFWFPRGWTIGAVMFVNLLAAHAVRFRIQSKGTLLYSGLGVIGLGSLLTWSIIETAATADGVQTAAVIGYDTVWQIMGLTLLAASGALVFLGLSDEQTRSTRWFMLSMAVLSAVGSSAVLLSPPLEDAGMRILYQLLKGTLCGLVLMLGCWMVFQKRAGVVLLHAGIGLLMVYEIIVGMNAGTMEASMQIEEGHTATYTTDIRSSELAVIDLSDAKEDVETIIPGRMLVEGAAFDDSRLPFAIELLDYYPHSDLYNKVAKFRMSRPGQPAEAPKEPDLATTGLGQTFRIVDLPTSVGTDTSGQVDTPSGYVRVIDRQTRKEVGIYLVTTILTRPESIQHNGKTYMLELRFRRTYTPFHLTLKDVQKNVYVGTDRPKDFRSVVTLVDKSHGTKLEDVHIWMNNPLRYGGFTFYQSNYDPGGQGHGEITSLQVVENEGWMIPYMACMITAVGMLFQFGVVLLRFLSRVAQPGFLKSGLSLNDDTDHYAFIGNTIAISLSVLVFGGIVVMFVRTKASDSEFDYAAFGNIPIFYEGRAQPIDSLARNALLSISDKDAISAASVGVAEAPASPEKPPLAAPDAQKADAAPVSKTGIPAVRWLLDVVTDEQGVSTDAADKHQVFRVENLELQKALGLEKRERFRYAIREFREKLIGMEKEIQQARDLKSDLRNLYQRKLLTLERQVNNYDKIRLMFTDPTTVFPAPPMPTMEQIQADPQGAQAMFFQLRDYLGALAKLSRDGQFAIVVPMDLGVTGDRLPLPTRSDWMTFIEAAAVNAVENDVSGKTSPAVDHWKGMLAAYRRNDPAKFNEHVMAYTAMLHAATPEQLTVKSSGAVLDLERTAFEHFFNRVGPLNLASWLYVLAFVLVALGWIANVLGGMRSIHLAALTLGLLTFGLHVVAISGRIYISGRPPVTNLYSAAVFIGAGAALFGLVLELFLKKGLGTTLACVAGYLSLRVANGLTTDGDTFAVLQAVLDTQFWLATHVVTISLGYSTTYVAGFIGVVYILGGILTPALGVEDRKRLASMMYGTLCFAIFFSFVGTVLGGLWADDSWGRFWGWDPKENGALIIVLWNALVLHARWGGMVRERGMASLAVLGNIVVSWSFFGVNELNVGLHSYGVTEGRAFSLAVFAGTQLVIALLAVLPRKAWWSFRRDNTESPSVSEGSEGML